MDCLSIPSDIETGGREFDALSRETLLREKKMGGNHFGDLLDSCYFRPVHVSSRRSAEENHDLGVYYTCRDLMRRVG